MNHPEFLLLPVLTSSDYLLTIAGARLRRGIYSEHFRTRDYELNPVWQEAVATLRWFNPRHVVLILALTALVLALVEWLLPPYDPLIPFLAGSLIGLLGAVNGRHLGNLAIFAYLKRHPDAISGAVTMDHEFVLWLSAFQGLVLVVPAALLAIHSRQPSMLGFFAGSVLLVMVHLIWILRHRRKQASAVSAANARPDRGESPSV